MKRLIFSCCFVFLSETVLAVFVGNEKFRYEEIDYTSAPVYKQIKKHPENYEYLTKVKIYRINYQSDGLVITGLMAAPATSGKYPVVVYNRGGNREYGSLLVAAGTDVLAPIAAEGYVVVASNYRGNSGSEGTEEFGGADVMDVINLAKNCGEYPDADTSKMALMGISRGAMMNYLTLKIADLHGLKFKCAISIGGITDLDVTIQHHPEIGTVCEEIVPDFVSNRQSEIFKRSAVNWVSDFQKNCPLLILHSYDDAAVAYSQIPVFADSLDKHQVSYQLFSYYDDNHGIVKHQAHVREQINRWLDHYLRKELPFSTEQNRIEVL